MLNEIESTVNVKNYTSILMEEGGKMVGCLEGEEEGMWFARLS